MKYSCCALVVTSLLFSGSSFAQTGQQRGTVIGGLAGAGLGAIIGDNSDEAGVGAAIGGVVGAVAGNVLGNANDRDARYYSPPPVYQAPYQPAYHQSYPAQNLPVTMQDVISLTQNRVSDGVIINAIQSKGIQRPLDVPDIVHLSQSGVSDAVIRVMQQAGSGSPSYIVTRPAYPTTIRMASPRPLPPYSIPYGHGHHHCRGNVYVR